MTPPQQLELTARRKCIEVTNLKASDTEQGVFTGIASAVGVLDAHNEVIEPGAFDGNDLQSLVGQLVRHLPGIGHRVAVRLVQFADDPPLDDEV